MSLTLLPDTTMHTPPLAPSGSSGAMMIVSADAPRLRVRLEQIIDEPAETVIVVEDDGKAPIEVDAYGVHLHSPDALPALVSCLLELMRNPAGARMLAAIPEPTDDDSNVDALEDELDDA